MIKALKKKKKCDSIFVEYKSYAAVYKVFNILKFILQYKENKICSVVKSGYLCEIFLKKQWRIKSALINVSAASSAVSKRV